MKRKIAVIGAGNVGATVAQYTAEANIADIVLVDIVEGMPQGRALDLTEAGPVRGYNAMVVGTNDYAEIAGSELVVVTAGIARKPGMTREDLLNTNAKIMGQVADNIKQHAPDAFVVIVSNPLDIMTYHALKVTGFSKHRVVGQAGVLDATRFKSFIAMELGVAMTDVHAMVLGGHGDTMVPLPRFTTVSGVPISELIPQDQIETLVDRTRNGGGEIVKHLKTGSAYYAPAASVVTMVKALMLDEKRLLPASTLLEGEFGLNDLCIGVPVLLGADGVEKVVEIELTDKEAAALKKSADTYREILTTLGY